VCGRRRAEWPTAEAPPLLPPAGRRRERTPRADPVRLEPSRRHVRRRRPVEPRVPDGWCRQVHRYVQLGHQFAGPSPADGMEADLEHRISIRRNKFFILGGAGGYQSCLRPHHPSARRIDATVRRCTLGFYMIRLPSCDDLPCVPRRCLFFSLSLGCPSCFFWIFCAAGRMDGPSESLLGGSDYQRMDAPRTVFRSCVPSVLS